MIIKNVRVYTEDQQFTDGEIAVSYTHLSVQIRRKILRRFSLR